MAGDSSYLVPDTIQQNLLNYVRRQVAPGEGMFSGFAHRDALMAIDREYYRDNIYTEDKVKARLANRQGDKKKLQDIVIPIMESQVETMKSYLVSALLTGNPLFGITADNAHIDAAKMAQAKVSEDSNVGNWNAEASMIIHDALKYFGVCEFTWCRETTYTPEINFDSTGRRSNLKKVIWEGNRLKRRSPYNSFWDRRVPFNEVHTRGEFAGYVTLENYTSLKSWIDSEGIIMNVDKLWGKDGVASANAELYFSPDFMWNSLDNLKTGPNATGNVITDFSNFENMGSPSNGRTIKAGYFKVVRYLRMVPRQFDMRVPLSNQVQIWKMVTINDQIVVQMERQTNAHSYLPLLFVQPVLDGMEFNSRSFGQKQIVMQDIGSTLLNGALASFRRSVGDRFAYDPSRVDKQSVDSDSPTARIAMRPAAYGSDVAKAFYRFPMDQREVPNFMTMSREIFSFSDMLSGQNKAQQGQFVKGNKTQAEYEDVQNKSSGRQQLVAINVEAQLFQPIKVMLRANMLQYSQSSVSYNYETKEAVNIDPVKLREAIISFKIVDGMNPEDKVVNAQMLGQSMQIIATNPMLQAAYNFPALFAYYNKTQNADIEQFRIQDQGVQDQNLAKIVAANNPQTLTGPQAAPKPAVPATVPGVPT